MPKNLPFSAAVSQHQLNSHSRYISQIFVLIVPLLTSVKTSSIGVKRDGAVETSGGFGAKTTNAKPASQAKRDTSLSYAATNIDSKEGTRVKTITVIKNHSGKKSDKLAINPELHKNEEWATAFRDNFDSYGVIPDVPDIDDLFEFVKKKAKGNEEGNNKTEAPKVKHPAGKDDIKPVEEPSAEEVTPEAEPPVQKIKGDAELVPGVARNQTSARSQSIALDKSQRQAPLLNVNNSTPQHSRQHHFDKYVQEIPNGYDYPKPCPHGGKNIVSITQSSGRTYDIPVEEDTAANPYIAPSVVKKTQVQPQSNTQNVATAIARPNYSVNSILPALQPTQGPVSSTTVQQQQPPNPQQVGFSTSQRPYVAPNIRNSFVANIGPPLRPTYHNNVPNYRTNAFGFGSNRAGAARSRGLKY